MSESDSTDDNQNPEFPLIDETENSGSASPGEGEGEGYFSCIPVSLSLG